MKFNAGLALSYITLAFLTIIYALYYWNYYIDISGPAVKDNSKIIGLKLFPFYEFIELKLPFFAILLVLVLLSIGTYYWFHPIIKKWLQPIVILSFVAMLFLLSYGPLKISYGKNESYTGTRIYSKIIDPYSKEQLPNELYLRLQVELWEARLLLFSGLFILSSFVFVVYNNQKKKLVFEELLDN